MKQNFIVTGMSCSVCVMHVEKAVSSLDGVKSVNVSLLNNKMYVDYDPSTVNAQDIILSVKKAGYAAYLSEAAAKDDPQTIIRKRKLRNFFISLGLLLILMYITMGHMLSLPAIKAADKNIHPFGSALCQCILSALILYINRDFLINGVKMLVHLTFGMDTLVSLGSVISWLYSFAVMLKIGFSGENIGQGIALHSYLYFESSAMIPVLISLGKLLESTARSKTAAAIKELVALKPRTAVRLKNGVEETIDTDDIKVGDILIVRSGETIPADGTITEGGISIDESALTGESLPVDKGFLDQVYQATTAYSGYIKFKVDKTDKDTVLANIIKTVEEAASGKAPIQRLADKICSVFVPFVLSVSIITFVIWLIKGYPLNEALNFAISVMVISCPCALGLATPTAIMAGTGKGASLGILIKSAGIFESSKKTDTILFDKTGTLTFGKLKVTDVIPWDGVDEQTLLLYAGALESMSEHPIAKAITEISRKGNFSCSEYKNLPVGGIEARINDKEIFGGSYKAFTAIVGDNKSISLKCDKLSETGKTPVIFTCNKKILGIIAVSDMIKPEAGEVIKKLEALGIECAMVTGDNPKTAKYIAEKTGISKIFAGISPVDKQKKVLELKEKGKKVAMVGDGINDAPALISADVGIAIGAGTDIALDSADIILSSGSLVSILNIIRLSRRTFKTIRMNLFWAFFYNTVGISVAAGLFYEPLGLKLNPMISAALMSCSSLFVVAGALSLRYFKAEEKNIQNDNSVANKNITIKDGSKEMEVKVIIEGMMCEHCTAHVAKAFNDHEGISASVDLASKTATLKLTCDYTDEELKKIVSDAGYEPQNIIR